MSGELIANPRTDSIARFAVYTQLSNLTSKLSVRTRKYYPPKAIADPNTHALDHWGRQVKALGDPLDYPLDCWYNINTILYYHTNNRHNNAHF